MESTRLPSPLVAFPFERPHVVVLGAGFAGLQAARLLRRAPVNLTIVDRHNHHLFQPLLYQVATAALEPADIAGPIRQLVRGPSVHVVMAEATGIDAAGKQLLLDGERALSWDYLIVATGSTHSYFGHAEWAQHAPGLKTLEDALEIRRRVLRAFEEAEGEPDPLKQRAWLTFVVVGAGPTGVELAGALAEIAREQRPRDFDHIDPRTARVVLLEGLPRVLTAYPEALPLRAERSLRRLGVDLRLNTKVTEIEEGVVRAGDETIEARTVLWGAGVAASPIVRSLGVELDRAGRVEVTPQLTVPGHERIYVVGDLAAIELDGKPVPGLAPAAMAEGKHAARSIIRSLQGQAARPFHYLDRGSFAVIGRGAAVGLVFNRLRMSGYLAWLAWLLIHIVFLVGFRNRIAVLFNWAYVYFSGRRHAQLIVGPVADSSQLLPDVKNQPRSADSDPPRSQAQPAEQQRPART